MRSRKSWRTAAATEPLPNIKNARARATHGPSEHAEQVAFIQAARTHLAARGLPPMAAFAVPNGSQRKRITGALLKAEGVVAGVPDILVLVPVEPYHGLAIEMKRADGGVVSLPQRGFIAMLKELGYAACVCHGAVEAMATLKKYLEGAADGKVHA